MVSKEDSYPLQSGGSSSSLSSNPGKGRLSAAPPKPSTATTTTTAASSSSPSPPSRKARRSLSDAAPFENAVQDAEQSVRESLTVSSADLQPPLSPPRNSSPQSRAGRKGPLSPETVSGTEIIGDGVSVATELTQSVAVDDDPASPEAALQRRHLQQNQRQRGQQHGHDRHRHRGPAHCADTSSTQNTEPANNVRRQRSGRLSPAAAEAESAASEGPAALHAMHAPPAARSQPAAPSPGASPDELRAHYEAMLAHLSSAHSAEIDAILEQLNSLEETYTLELQAMQDELTKREIMTDALTNSLTEMRTKSFNDRNALLSLESENASLREDLRRKGGELERWRTEVQEVESQRKAVMEREETRRVDAVAQAQEEIRTAAEEQFAHAQQMFFQLKQDYQLALTERDQLTQLADAAKKDGEVMVRKQKGQLAALMAELAESRAELATAQADAMKLKQTYGEKVQKLLDRENDLEGRLIKVEKECKDTHQLVEQVVMEKDELKAENQELQNVCEELMGMVEGSKNK